jgi:CheY-like chemotaxis protein
MLQTGVGLQAAAWRRTSCPVFAPASADGPSSSSGTQGTKVLIVEDDHLVAIEAEYALLEAGYEVAGIAATAAEAFALARTEKPDIVVMDIRLAGDRDGIDAAIELFTDSGLRSLFASAHGDAATRSRAQAAKPFFGMAFKTLSAGSARKSGEKGGLGTLRYSSQIVVGMFLGYVLIMR